MRVSTYTFIDSFEVSTKVAVVTDTCDLPQWLRDFMVPVTPDDLRMALLRYPDSLIRKLEMSPKQLLRRVPSTHTLCTLRQGCMGWDERACQRLDTNLCPLLNLSDGDDEPHEDITRLVNLLRDGYQLAQVI